MKRTPKIMTQAQAFRRAARERVEREVFVGLCAQLSRLLPSWPERGYATARICDHVVARNGENGSAYAYGDFGMDRSENNEARVLAALWMAHECEEEGV